MNPNTEYERFTQEVYRQLSKYHHLNIKTVQHNIKLKGRSECEHQIDVYWEYEKDGVNHRVAIECKNYKNCISISKVRDFFGVLCDIGDIQGIMVTTAGYQKGAKQFAKEYGISLKELRTPNDDETIIGEIELRFHIEKKSTLFKIDEKWAEKHGINITDYKCRLDMISIKNDHLWSNATHIPLPISDDIIRDSKGNKITTLKSGEENIAFEDAYINTSYWGPIKILEVKHEHSTEDIQRNISIDAEGFVKAILKDIFSNNTEFVVMR